MPSAALPAALPLSRGALLLASLVALSTLAPGAQGATEPTPGAQAHGEIEALLNRLENSGCRFNRNGDWHTGSEARGHLLRKLEYLERKQGQTSTEDFINQAASQSSTSGQAYQVQCGNSAPEPSKAWLLRQLQGLRSGKGA